MNENATRNSNQKEYLEIDLLQLFSALWKRVWFILLAMIVVGGGMFWYSSFIIDPQYTASAMLYVNNSSISVGGASISISNQELTAAQSLVNTYVVILNSRNVLDDVIEDTGVAYTYEEIKEMISAAPVDSTEVFEVCVKSTDPAEAELIANSICRLLPEKVEDIVDGSSVRIVDYAVIPATKSAPSVTKYTAIGLLLGCLISSVIIIVSELFDQYIRTEEYLLQAYADIPVLAVIPDLESSHSKDRYYYSSNHSKGD